MLRLNCFTSYKKMFKKPVPLSGYKNKDSTLKCIRQNLKVIQSLFILGKLFYLYYFQAARLTKW